MFTTFACTPSYILMLVQIQSHFQPKPTLHCPQTSPLSTQIHSRFSSEIYDNQKCALRLQDLEVCMRDACRRVWNEHHVPHMKHHVFHILWSQEKWPFKSHMSTFLGIFGNLRPGPLSRTPHAAPSFRCLHLDSAHVGHVFLFRLQVLGFSQTFVPCPCCEFSCSCSCSCSSSSSYHTTALASSAE